MKEKVYDLKNLSIVLLAKMTYVKKPTAYKYGRYESSSMPGAFFAEKIEGVTKNVYNLVTKKQYVNDNPQYTLRKGAKYVVREYDAGLLFALPILITNESKMNISQLRKIEEVWLSKGYINFDAIEKDNAIQFNKSEAE